MEATEITIKNIPEFIMAVLRMYKYKLIPDNAKYCWVSASTTRKKYIYISLKCTLQDGKNKTRNLKDPEEIELARIEVLIFRYKKKLEKILMALKISPTKSIKEVMIKTICDFIREIIEIRKDDIINIRPVKHAIELMTKIGFKINEVKQILLWLEKEGCLMLHPGPAMDFDAIEFGIYDPNRGVLQFITFS